jgi:pimeloyl-ACP methyl ester carboxylesterase
MAVPPTIPITILSAASATADEIKERERWAGASVRGRHKQIADSGHWIHLEHPEQVGAAVIGLVAYLRDSPHPQQRNREFAE